MKEKIWRQRFFLITYFTILIFLVCTPMLKHGFIIGDDYEYHLSRIQNISDCLSLGIFPAKIHVTSLNGYGYGSGLFYPDLFLYFPAVLRFLGLSLSVSYKIFLSIVVSLTVISFYFSAKYIFKSRYAGVITSTLFITSQTQINNMYGRTAIGETLAAIFIPIVITSLYDVINNRVSKPCILILGICGFIYSHTISTFLVCLIFILILAFNYKIFFSNQGLNILKKSIVSLFVASLLSISYWLPMVEQLCSSNFNVNNNVFILSDSFLKITEIFERMGNILLIISATTLVFALTKKASLARKFIVIGFILCFITSDLFKCQILDDTIINKIQFIWRLFPFASAFLCMGIGGCTVIVLKKIEQRGFFLVLIFALNIISLRSFLTHTHLIELPSDICNQKFPIGYGAEWLPMNTDTTQLNTPDKVYVSNGRVINLDKKMGNKIFFKYDKKSGIKSVCFDVPLLFYKGYRATILKSDGKKKTLDVINSPNNNLCRVLNNKNYDGNIVVEYKGTLIQHISYFINLFVIIIWIFMLLKKYKYKIKTIVLSNNLKR